MKRVLAATVVALTFLVAVEAAVSARPIGPPPILGGSQPASPWAEPLSEESLGVLSTCSTGYRYAEYQWPTIPASSSSAGVKWNTTTLYSGGHVGGWVGVSNNAATRWIQAGLERTYGDSSISKYIEYKTDAGYSFVNKGTASAGTVYTAVVTKVAAGSWTASIGGSGLGFNISLSDMQKTDFAGESYQGINGNCNVMDINFSNSSTGTGSMTKIQNSPYVVDSITSNGWRSHGG